MVTLKHEIPAGMDYQYAEHTISERPGPILRAGMTSTSHLEQRLARLEGHSVGQPQLSKNPFRPMNPFLGMIEAMSAEGRQDYVRQLDILLEQKLPQAASRDQPAAAPHDYQYQLQLEVLEIQNQKRTLQARIEDDEKQGAALRTLVSKPRELHYRQQLYLLEGKRRRQLATLKEAYMEIPSPDQTSKPPFLTPKSFWDPTPGIWERDYECQLRFLKQQNESATADAQGSTDSFVDLQHQHRTHRHSERMKTVGNHALQDYQMQIMLLEQQNKKRLMMARADAGTSCHPQNDSLTPVGHTTPFKRRVADMATSEHPSIDVRLAPLNEYRTSHHNNNAPAVFNPLPMPQEAGGSWNQWPAPPSSQFNQPQGQHYSQVNGPANHYGHHEPPPMTCFDPSDVHGNLADILGNVAHHAKDIQDVPGPGCSAFTFDPQENSHSASTEPKRQRTSHPFVSGPSNCLADYQRALMLHKQQNQGKFMPARWEQDAMSTRVEPPNDPAYQMQLILLEEQSKKRFMTARPEPDSMLCSTETRSSPEVRSFLPGSPGMSCSPAPSSFVFTPQSSVTSPLPENDFNEGRPLVFRGPAPQPASDSYE
ncbi:hypothetical protein EG329_011639 [Mollisiaceae sp. DMI_Dod_QoI]|nr:hypothetical protein EG329_011639 [Helotiales sp. DMI_Dod_QoI]